MQPYVIKRGDFLAALAHQFSFDADTVWNDPKNAQIRQLRPNPNILFAGDILYIPDQIDSPPPAQRLTPGTTNLFVSSPPTVTVSVQFTDPTLASQPFTVRELAPLTGLTSDASGTVTFEAPVDLSLATVVFTESGATYVMQIGGLDPINTVSGVFQRLQHLGFIDSSATFDPSDLDLVRGALRDFGATQAGGGPDATYPSAPPPPPSTPVPSSPSPSSPTASVTPAPSSPPSSPPPASSPPPSSTPAPSSFPPASSPLSAADDDAGLDDNGTLDAVTSAQLVAAHGS